MRHRTAQVIVAALVAASALVLSPAPAQAVSATGPTPVQYRSGTDAQMRMLLTGVVKAGVPGVVARVQDGRDIRAAAAGVADVVTGAPLRPEARFRVGSITKTFVATVVLQLAGEGRLSLDEKVGARLPGLLAKGNRITVRQLLNHTSGIFDYTHDPATTPTGMSPPTPFPPLTGGRSM